MTQLMLTLPDELARRAGDAGLLTDAAIRRLLEQELRREAGRRLLEIANRIHAAGPPPMSVEAVTADVKAARSERRARERGVE